MAGSPFAGSPRCRSADHPGAHGWRSVTSAMASAVSRGGGLGSLPCALSAFDQIREDVQAIRRNRGAINLNFFSHTPALPDSAREAAWRHRLKPYYAGLSLGPETPIPDMNIPPFGEQHCALLEELKPGVVSFHFGLPSRNLVDRSRQRARWWCRLQPLLTKRYGSKRTDATLSSRKGSRLAGTAAYSSPTICPRNSARWRWYRGGRRRPCAGDRGRRHRGRARHRSRADARRSRGADGNGLSVLPGDAGSRRCTGRR